MNNLIVLVGCTGSGKTFIQSRMLDKFASLSKVRTTTTRPPRLDEGLDAYHFLTKPEFERDWSRGRILERDTFRGEFYGVSKKAVYDVLEKSHAILAVTPLGAVALNKEFRGRARIFMLRPDTRIVHDINLRERGLRPMERVMEMEKAHYFFRLPGSVAHTVVRMRRHSSDVTRFVELISPFVLSS